MERCPRGKQESGAGHRGRIADGASAGAAGLERIPRQATACWWGTRLILNVSQVLLSVSHVVLTARSRFILHVSPLSSLF